MARPIRPSTLFWVLFLALGGTAWILHQRTPQLRALPWITSILMGMLTLRVLTMAWDWRMGRIPATRLLLPAVVLAEGLGLLLGGATNLALKVRLGTALALEILLLALAFRALAGAHNLPGIWPEDRIAKSFEAFVPPRVARLMGLELVILGGAISYIFGGFRRAAPEGFSHHREAALGSFLPVLPLLIPGDVLLLKVLFSGWAPWLRWTLHLSTVYAVLWLVGLYTGLKRRPHQVTEDAVELNLGPVKSVRIPRDQILAASPLPEFDDDWARHRYMKGVHRLVTPGPTVLELRLREPVQAMALLGLTSPKDRIAVSVDDPSAFIAALGCPCA